MIKKETDVYMKFLLPELFYPNRLDENFNEEEHFKEIKIAQENYNNYFEESKSMIDKRLLKLYEKTDRFHDYIVHDIDFQTHKNGFLKEKKDEIILILQSDDAEIIHLSLKDIVCYKLDFDQLGWTKREKQNGLGEIILCEIGYEQGYSFINFVLVYGAEISIYFQMANYKIEKYKN